MSVEMDKFKQALAQADTGDIDMSVADWAQSVGLMTTYGHGYIWDLPRDESGWIDVPAIVDIIEEYVADEEQQLMEMEMEIGNEL